MRAWGVPIEHIGAAPAAARAAADDNKRGGCNQPHLGWPVGLLLCDMRRWRVLTSPKAEGGWAVPQMCRGEASVSIEPSAAPGMASTDWTAHRTWGRVESMGRCRCRPLDSLRDIG